MGFRCWDEKDTRSGGIEGFLSFFFLHARRDGEDVVFGVDGVRRVSATSRFGEPKDSFEKEFGYWVATTTRTHGANERGGFDDAGGGGCGAIGGGGCVEGRRGGADARR